MINTSFYLMVTLVSLALLSTANSQGDYVNHFVAYVNDQSAVEDVVHHLQKRGAIVTSKLYTQAHGLSVHFQHERFSSRSKRSVYGHSVFDDLSSHHAIVEIEQQKELIRHKRDYFTDKQLSEARRILLDLYEKEMSKRKDNIENDVKKVKDVKKKFAITHDKQSELKEFERYYDDKSVYRRFSLDGDKSQAVIAKDYIPGEERHINLNDEYIDYQWYLMNNGQAGGPKGLDVNVLPAWQQGYSGKGVTVCILDDGIDHEHDDLRDNYEPLASKDLNSAGDDDPEPDPQNLDENSHGTKCAGEIAAVANNSICGVGIAFSAKVGGIRILDGPVTDSLEAQALLFNNDLIDIYSASWGPRDTGDVMEAPNKLCEAALEEGAKSGRGGKGSIFVWATGNGGGNGDDCSADGYVSNIHTLSIGSINNYAESTYFMEWCPSTMAVIYTGGYHALQDYVTNDDEKHPILKIVTTDVRNKCTLNFQGTSSAAPLAAGAMAVVLEANPDLTWRDLQHIVVHTAKIPNSIEQGWTINGAGLHVNEKFGYGALDVAQMVQVAQTWSTVAAQHKCVNTNLTKGSDSKLTFAPGQPRIVSADLDGCQMDSDEQRTDKLEHVQLYVKLSHNTRGNVKIVLTSPAGTPSEMLSPRDNDKSTAGIDFTFMTVRCWGENPRGMWKVNITDVTDGEHENKDGGELLEWGITLYGTAVSERVRDATSDTKPAKVSPAKSELDQIMKGEKNAAENVSIELGEEKEVIEKFSSDTQATDDKDKTWDDAVKRLTEGKSHAEIENLLNVLKREYEEAKQKQREREERELEDKIRKWLSAQI